MYIRVPVRHALGAVVGPFEGTFVGEIKGDGETKTTITALLTHQDRTVAGKIRLGTGLKLDFPGPRFLPDLCGIEPVDLREFDVKGESVLENSSRATVTGEADEPSDQFKPLINSIKIGISITGTMSGDGKTLDASVILKPSKCGARTFAVKLTR